MKTKDITRIAFLASILACVFQMFSHILYLELITFTIVLFSMLFSKRDAILSCIVFGIINMLFQGITIWSILYVFIYPFYAFFFSLGKDYLQQHTWLLYCLCGFASFLTGQLLDLPYLLFSGKITVLYLLMGLKTSLIQGILSFLVCMFLYDPLYQRLDPISKER